MSERILIAGHIDENQWKEIDAAIMARNIGKMPKEKIDMAKAVREAMQLWVAREKIGAKNENIKN